MYSNSVVKRAMQQFLIRHEISVARMNIKSNVWGYGARTNAKRISYWASKHGYPNIQVTGDRTSALVDLVLPGMIYAIKRDFQAVTFGEERLLPSIKYIVLHSMEYRGTKDAAEALGRMVENPSYGASPHFGIDNNSIQQYLPLNRTGWHCTNFNYPTVGIEMAGCADNSRTEWLTTYAGTIDRAAWLVGKQCRKLSLPLEFRDARWLEAHGIYPWKRYGGVTTHQQHTLAFQPGDHVDPGVGFPVDILLAKAKRYWG